MVATALNAADLAIIRGGGLCVKEHWVSQQLQRALRDDILCLEARGSFKPSGLTSRLARVGVPENELFGESDRRVCVIDDRGDGDVGGDDVVAATKQLVQRCVVQLAVKIINSDFHGRLGAGISDDT